MFTALKHPLPSPRISFERQFEVLRAYVAASKDGKEAVGYNDFGKLTVSPTNVSGNNKFFEHLTLIAKAEGAPGKYVPTKDAIQICKDFAWKKEDNVRSILADLISRSWFGESAKTLLATRGRVTENDLLAQLGYDSGADPEKHMASLKVLVEYLKFSGLIRLEDGLFTAVGVLTPPPNLEIQQPFTNLGTPTQAQPDRLQTPYSGGPPVIVGVFVSADMSEEQIRKTIRIVLEETQNK